MHWSFALLAIAATAPQLELDPAEATHYTNYTQAWKAARAVRQPLLVILNPSPHEAGETLAIQAIRKTAQRRTLLENYVVVVLDTSTSHGKLCYELFGKPELPRVVVIDKDQRYQIFKTSEPLYGQLWTKILETYRRGERPVAFRSISQSRPAYSLQQHAFCPT